MKKTYDSWIIFHSDFFGLGYPKIVMISSDKTKAYKKYKELKNKAGISDKIFIKKKKTLTKY